MNFNEMNSIKTSTPYSEEKENYLQCFSISISPNNTTPDVEEMDKQFSDLNLLTQSKQSRLCDCTKLKKSATKLKYLSQHKRINNNETAVDDLKFNFKMKLSITPQTHEAYQKYFKNLLNLKEERVKVKKPLRIRV